MTNYFHTQWFNLLPNEIMMYFSNIAFILTVHLDNFLLRIKIKIQ